MRYAVVMSSPMYSTTSDEVLAAILARSGNTLAVTEDEILNIRRNPQTVVVRHDPGNAAYVVQLGNTPAGVAYSEGAQDVRDVGPQ